MLPFSEARFQYQELLDGRPGRLFDGPSLRLLESPWANAGTGDLLARMEQDVSIAGNCFLTVRSGRLVRLRPDWVTIVSGVRGNGDAGPLSLDSEVLGYVYQPAGVGVGRYEPEVLSVDQVAHYAPIPDPEAQWRGMSWLTPVLREVAADSAATVHKETFFRRGAQLGVVVKYPAQLSADEVARVAEVFRRGHAGVGKAYETLHLGGGADVTTVGTDLRQLDFRATQGAGESRIAAAAGVGAIIARFSEGMAGSSLNAGNYAAAKRQFADMTLRPLWRSAAGTLTKFVDVPTSARLWPDLRDVEFLKDDLKDAVQITSVQASTIRVLIDAGFAPDAAIDAVEAGDLSRLEGKHSGLYSVQLQALSDGSESSSARQLSAAEILQKVYLAVGAGVISADEARQIANAAGANLTGPAPAPIGG
jgi:phage portal protein BeeE